MYSVAQAANYLGKSRFTIQYHVYKTKKLIPQKISGVLFFTKADLDALEKKTKPGKPRIALPSQEALILERKGLKGNTARILAAKYKVSESTIYNRLKGK